LNQWLLLIYKIPREPTVHRVSIWRKLKQLGAMLLHDAVWVLPATPHTREQFQWLAAEIGELGGEATIWTSETTEENQRARLVKEFSTTVDDAYKEIIGQLKHKNADRAALARRYQQVLAQDYFRSKFAERARKALLDEGKGKL
jgi:DNA-binding transcriptional regulator PaaX